MTLPLLAIDTAGPRLQFALLTGDGCEVLTEAMAQGQAERIVPAMLELLARRGLRLADLKRVAVTTGPGSFTGLRIGLSVARGLGVSLDIPIIGVPSLLAISLGRDGPQAVLLDARRDEAYFQRFSVPGQALGAAQLLPMGEARARVETGDAVVTADRVDMEALAHFAAAADPDAYPPEASYVRSADAKPQERFRVARTGA